MKLIDKLKFRYKKYSIREGDIVIVEKNGTIRKAKKKDKNKELWQVIMKNRYQMIIKIYNGNEEEN